MEAKEEFEVDHLSLTTPTGTSFSQLLLGDDDDDEIEIENENENENALGLTVDQTYNNLNTTTTTTVFSIHNTPKMLCFGNYQHEGDLLFSETNLPPPQKSVITSSDSSSASSRNHTNTSFNSLITKSNSLQKKRNGSGQEAGTKEGIGGQRAPKKNKAENNTTSTGHAKKKEKLGERIAALQQLVSPFGKTDTASVLHEATGYIRFLHDQVQVLCSPYLQSPHLQFQHHPGDGDNYGGGEAKKDLRSRGLCLIPVGCTIHVASSNGADFWSPAAIGNNVSLSPSGSAKQ